MKKILAAIGIILVIFVGACAYFASLHQPAKEFEWGLTFSQKHATWLGFDWKVMYLDMLNDLQPRKLRLMAYWDVIEKEKGKYDFSEAALMLAEAQKRNIDVILVVGMKEPRWPECHHPAWLDNLGPQEKEAAQLEFVRNSVDYYKQFSAIKIWQVENEALFSFGEDCPQTPKDLIKKEMAIVRERDPRPILLTDSGELGRWIPAARLEPDLFGTTMYRVVHNPRMGYFKYPLPAFFFHVKAGVLKKFTGMDSVIGVELQAEPWFSDDITRTDLKTQYALMNPKILREYSEYAKDAGFHDNYLWGVEWWYWLAHKQNDWGMWNEAKQIMLGS